MGSLGVPEMIFIFVLALLLFGPKKLPEVGRTLGKAMSEFRRASSELKATFDREMQNLERETEGIKEVATTYEHDTYNYDYSSYDSGYYGSESQDSTATEATTASASAIEGAESHAVTNPPEGTIVHGTESAAASSPGATSPESTIAAEAAQQPATVGSPDATEHKA